MGEDENSGKKTHRCKNGCGHCRLSLSKKYVNAIIKVLIELFQKFAVSKGSAFGRPSQWAKLH